LRKADKRYHGVSQLSSRFLVESEEVQPGIVLDYDKDERVVGIEILSLSKRVVPDMIKRFEYEAA